MEALQLLGLSGLGSGGGFERLHFLFERAFDGPELSLVFLKVVPNFPIALFSSRSFPTQKLPLSKHGQGQFLQIFQNESSAASF